MKVWGWRWLQWRPLKKSNMIAFGIGVLLVASLGVTPWYGRYAAARDTVARTELSALCTAAEDFEVDCWRYPTAREWETALHACPAGLEKKWRGPYLYKAIATDPWGAPYRYIAPGIHNKESYDLVSAGPDRKFGTKDDVTNYRDQ